MNLNLTGNHLDVTPAIRDYVVAKIGRVKKHFDHVIEVNVVLSVDKLQHRIEVNLHTRGKDIHAEAVEADMYAAIDVVADKLDRQVLKHKEKRSDHRYDATAKREGASTEASPSAEGSPAETTGTP